jgi:hypothetical protein
VPKLRLLPPSCVVRNRVQRFSETAEHKDGEVNRACGLYLGRDHYLGRLDDPILAPSKFECSNRIGGCSFQMCRNFSAMNARRANQVRPRSDWPTPCSGPMVGLLTTGRRLGPIRLDGHPGQPLPQRPSASSNPSLPPSRSARHASAWLYESKYGEP